MAALVARKEREIARSNRAKTRSCSFVDFLMNLTADEGTPCQKKEKKEESKEGQGLPPTPMKSLARI